MNNKATYVLVCAGAGFVTGVTVEAITLASGLSFTTEMIILIVMSIVLGSIAYFVARPVTEDDPRPTT